MISSFLYSIHGCPQLSRRSLHWLSSNLSRLSATPTAPIKSQFCSWSLHRLSSNLPWLSATPTAPLKSQLPTLLIKAFKRRVIDTNEFSPIIDVGHICCSVVCYERYVECCIAVMGKVCYCSGLFISSSSSVVVLRSDPMVVIALNKDAINIAFFDHYSQKIDEYRFCYLCFNILK